MSEEFLWIISTLVPIGIVFLITFLFHLVRAPVYIKWEDEKRPRITVSPHSGRRQEDWQHQHLMWAELEVENTSISLPLKDVEVKVAEVIDILPKQDVPNEYFLYPVQQLSPMGICWSERFASPNQLSLTIPPSSAKSALVAFSGDSNGGKIVFNAHTSPKPLQIDGARIQIEVSSPDCAPWQGSFYIQCHPNYTNGTRARFEFVEWGRWASTHHVIVHPSVADKVKI